MTEPDAAPDAEPGADPAADPAAKLAELAAFSTNMAKVLERSQAIWMRLLKASMEDARPLRGDPLNILPAFMELHQAMMENPRETAERTLELWTRQAELWRRATARMFGAEEIEPVAAPRPGDKRFRHEEWSRNVAFDYIKQSYLLASEFVEKTVAEAGDLSERDRRKVAFYARQFVEALSPSNFAATNPEVIEATLAEKGENLVRGLEMLAEDLERGKGRLLIRQTDMTRFEVGRDLAVTPGKVIFQNDIMQLIQYAPSTEKVRAVPLLFVPPWINKYYVLDLTPEKSLVRWLVAEGFTVFLISWINPGPEQGGETWESYLQKGPLTAIDKAMEETGAKEVNIASYCIGGSLSATMAAWMGRRGDRRVRSVTFFTALVDFEDAGELQVLVDDETLKIVDEQMDKGYLPAETMATAFNMLRASDLIWSYVVSNYYLGREPFPFDLLYWNADSTAMPARVHHFYLEKFYNENAFARGELEILGERVTPADIRAPVYHVAAKEDHIAPAASVYAGARMMTGARARFVLAGSGHIAGVVNPPEKRKYQYWTREDLAPETLDEWTEGAEERPGSWWPDWSAWLSKRSGRLVRAREPGAVLGVLEDAPGSYVKKRFDEG